MLLAFEERDVAKIKDMMLEHWRLSLDEVETRIDNNGNCHSATIITDKGYVYTDWMGFTDPFGIDNSLLPKTKTPILIISFKKGT